MRTKKFKLKEIASISAGSTAPDDKYFGDQGYPFIRVSHLDDLISGIDINTIPKISEKHAEVFKLKKVRKGTLLLAKSGMSCLKNRVYQCTTDSFVVNHLATIDVKNELADPSYICYFLRWFNVSKLIVDEAYPSIRTSAISEIEVSLPDMKEQRTIITLLDKAQTLIDKRKQAIAKLDELVQAVFLDMFGQFSDTNCKIKDVIISLQAGLSTGGETRQKQGSELGVLTTSAVTSGEFIDTAYKVPSEKDIKLNKLVFPTKNSILVSRINTRELVGASAIIEKDYNDLFIPDRLWKLTLDQRIVNPYYFLFVIQAKKIRDEVSRLSSGTSGSMLNISQEKYLGIDFYLPAKQLQDQFASMIIQIRNTKNKMKLQLQQLESNFQALLQKAFKGELTVKDGVAV
ncbi:restriction endonuclease subunit S [Cohnella thermotolerans]|uniref:restriction endonuclease subunit S n=1 Tax=Cohnella thermotolerans TaxID=329858 RepID=UPI0004011751|nr:restriction endonuclease subunit S [Cohnella thermotolerans]